MWKHDTRIRPGNEVHVWPVSEEREHALHGESCECAPEVQEFENGCVVIVHNEMDSAVKSG